MERVIGFQIAEVQCVAWKAVVRKCSIKKVLLKISQTPQEKACARVSVFNKDNNKQL